MVVFTAGEMFTFSRQQAYASALAPEDMRGRYAGFLSFAWAIGGKHDRPWAPKRNVFGMIRFMSGDGCARKFNVPAYIERVNKLVRGAQISLNWE